MEITVSNRVFIQNVPSALGKAIEQRLTFINPQWMENERLGHWNGQTPQYLKFFRRADNGLLIPRGFLEQLIGIFRSEGVRYEVIDQKRTLPEVSFSFSGTLKPFQERAVKDVLARDFGTLSAPTGSGKTVMALHMIAQRRQPALVVCHTKELADQWVDRIGTFLEIPKDEVGIIGNGKHSISEKITVALVQSLYKCATEIAPKIGFLVVDECHRAPSRTFTEAVTAFDCRYMLGLSATTFRRDGLSRLIFWHLGNIAHKIEKGGLIKTGDVLRADVIFRETSFRTSLDASEEYSRMLSELTEDRARNALIASDVVKQAGNGDEICLVLSDRKAHCEALAGLIERHGVPVEILTGDLSNGKRRAVIDRLNAGSVKVLVATGQLIGEGFDCKALSTLFLATPIKFSGRLIQYLGRVLRPAPGKSKAKVFDYVDSYVGVLKAAARARMRVYGN